jgi:hypothetical protein
MRLFFQSPSTRIFGIDFAYGRIKITDLTRIAFYIIFAVKIKKQ